jgi:hypothetical protein
VIRVLSTLLNIDSSLKIFKGFANYYSTYRQLVKKYSKDLQIITVPTYGTVRAKCSELEKNNLYLVD